MMNKIARLTLIISLLLAPQLALASSSLQQQIDVMNARIARNQRTLSGISARADTLQNRVDSLNGQINQLQQQIELANLKIKQTNQQIAETKAELEHQKNIMFENARVLYEQGETSIIEILASSNSFTEFVNRQEYLEQVKESVNQAAQEVIALKDKLEQRVAKLKSYLEQQEAQQRLIASKRNEQAQLLAQTRGEESRYRHIVANQKAAIGRLIAAQRASYTRIFGGHSPLVYKNLGAQVPCGGGYDARLCSADKDSQVDQWDLYNRECVSYAAWAMVNRFHKTVYPFHGAGNAYQWPDTTSSYATVNDVPAAGTVAIVPQAMIGGVGHAMVVESVLGGGWIHVSQYNFDSNLSGNYSEMDVKSDGLIFIHFPSL